VLELWDGRGDAEPVLRIAAAETAADADAVTRTRRRLQVVARSPVLQRIAAAETVGLELPVRFLENGVIVERRLDRLIRENGTETVIDYKTGAADPDRVATDREQVQRYCAAVRAITSRDCRGLLWYVDDDVTVEC
jgi:hypothetical protein